MEVSEYEEISELIYTRLKGSQAVISTTYKNSEPQIGYFFIDDVLPEALALQCFNVFPDTSAMRNLKSLREYKYVSAQMNKHNPFLEAVIYAFQHPKIVKLIGDICEIDTLFADESLYAGGLSLMTKDNFLHPHLDNSHDAERQRWRVLNLLYYVTPNWESDNGGHLEIWPEGPRKESIIIESKFNRLVVMATHDKSWHSVNKVNVNRNRCCISNYFFSNHPLKVSDKFHVTKFRGRPEDTLRNIILDLDSTIRMGIRKIFKNGIRKNPHIYKKKD